MPHVDEGTLHALLDGELEPAAVQQVQTHFATCPACAARLVEAKHLLAETERLVSALEVPPAGDARPAAGFRGAVGGFGDAAAPTHGAPLPLDPLVLIPDNPTPTEIRRSRWRTFAWAAAFLMVAGAGFVAFRIGSSGRPAGEQSLRLNPLEFTTGPQATPAAAPADSSAQLAAAPPAEAPPQQPAAGLRADAASSREQRPAAKSQNKPPVDTAKPGPQPTESTADDRLAAQRRSTAATEALDRQKMRERAAAATALLEAQKDAERRAASQAAAPPPAPAAPGRGAADAEPAAAGESVATAAAAPRPEPPVPSLEQQAGIYARIGLDEAARQLGGPLHAIDGMSRQFVGLVPGTAVPGADPSRPVVRAVYLDRTGKMLFLDQQRVRPGQATEVPSVPQTGRSGEQHWVTGAVLLVLHGEDAAPDALRDLAGRVR
jgi:hypothetical protein